MTTQLLFKPGGPGEAALWIVDARGRPQASDADELGLSDDLADRLEEWLDALDAAFDDDATGTRHFDSEAERRAFHAEGLAIAQAIRGELGREVELDVNLAILER